ncbi:MAG: hypothetical protein Tsb004_15630 [Allomuricauda sp.]
MRTKRNGCPNFNDLSPPHLYNCISNKNKVEAIIGRMLPMPRIMKHKLFPTKDCDVQWAICAVQPYISIYW